jgi:curved DNA-binding protein CbpA
MILSEAETIFSRFGVKNPLQYTPDQLKTLYLALAKKNHPDRGGSVRSMQEINDAYAEILRVKRGIKMFFNQ